MAVETPQQIIWRLATAARNNNPIESPRLMGGRPWTISTAFTLGQVIGNGGYVYTCTIGGTSAATGTGPAGFGAAIIDGTATWAWSGIQTAPNIFVNATHTAALTSTLGVQTATNPYIQTLMPQLPALPIRWRGGVPCKVFAGGGVGMACTSVDPSTSGGNLGIMSTQDGTRLRLNSIWGSQEYYYYGNKFELQFAAGDTLNFCFIVDGKYVDYQPNTLGSGTTYMVVDFTNVVSPLGPMTNVGLAAHRVICENVGYSTFTEVAFEPTGYFYQPQVLDDFSVVVVGDSQTLHDGTVGSTPRSASLNFVVQLMHMMGWPDVAICGIGGTGFLATSGPFPNFLGHAARDLLWLQRYRTQGIGAILMMGSQNDVGFNPTFIQSNAVATIQSIRAIGITCPIFVRGNITGPTGGANSPTAATPVENAVMSAVAYLQSLGDTNLYAVPMLTDAGPLLLGTGHIGATTGDGPADYMIDADGVHLATAGVTWHADLWRQAILKAIRNG